MLKVCYGTCEFDYLSLPRLDSCAKHLDNDLTTIIDSTGNSIV